MIEVEKTGRAFKTAWFSKAARKALIRMTRCARLFGK
jgi:hypothetical protein